MECPNCKTQNPEGAKFCHNCGTPLQLACRTCGTGLVPGAKFCFNCGTPVPPMRNGEFGTRNNDEPVSIPNSEFPIPHSNDPALARLQQYIPKELLGKLEQVRANRSMAGERRIVTVLFCDVKGSTGLAEMLDPEEWAEIMNGAFKYLIEPVYRYEGTLARLMGDAILAFFGAPIGHEDDPQRAVLAGLDIVEGMKTYRDQMKREHGMDLNVRIGINTGLVVVGEVGSDLRVEYTAMGDAVNMASRMEQTAEPGTVQISGNTYKSVSNLFEFKSLGEIEVKGKTEPVPAYQVLRPIEGAVPTRGIEGLQSPLVGRERELSSLHAAVDELLQGKGLIVSVMGEAGLGKSRLIAELRNQWAVGGGQGSGIRDQVLPSDNPQSAIRNPQWYEGRSLSYETTTPYAPFIDMFDELFDLHAGDTDDLKYNKLKEKLDEVMPGRGDDIAPYLASLLGIELSGDDVERVCYLEPLALRGRVFYAVGTLVGAMASAGPCVLVFEDLHWADPTSLGLIESLLPITRSAPLMLLSIFRPQYGRSSSEEAQPPRTKDEGTARATEDEGRRITSISQDPSWHFHEIASRDYAHSYTPVTLQPLDEGDSRRLVANLLEIEDLPEKVRALILKKAEGNPFFVEEVIRSLLDAKLVVRVGEHWQAMREIENIAVPDTLAGVITARLDRLDDELKYVAQTASVIGREFQYDVLGDVYEAPQAIDGALSNLQRRELIRMRNVEFGMRNGTDPIIPNSAFGIRHSGSVYLFKHVLTQETAYASVLLSRRRELHLKVGECLERVEPERVNEIGRHFLEARQEGRALPYLLDAGDRALRSGAREEAADYFGKAIEAIHKADNHEIRGPSEVARRAYEGLGKAREFAMSVPGAMQTYHEMLQFGREHSDAAMQVSALNKLSLIEAMMLGQFAEAEKHLVEAEEVARQSEEVPGLIELYTVRCNMCSAVADFGNASKYLTEAALLGRKLDNIQTTAYGLAHKSNTLVHMTEYDEAWETGLEGLKVAEEANNLERRADILTYVAPMYHLRNGHLAEAQQAAEEGYAIGAKIGATYPPMLGAFVLGYLTQAQGDYEAAMQWFERALEHARPVFDFLPFMTAIPLGGMGSVCLGISEKLVDKVVKLHTEALEILRTPTGAPAGGSGWADLGFCALELGQLDRADEYFQNGLNSPSIQMYEQRPRLLIGAGLVAIKRNRLDEAAKILKEARQYAEERRMKFMYPLINIAEAKMSAARGDTEDALKHYKAAEELASEMMLRPDLLQARLGAAAVLAGCGQLAEAQDVRRAAQATIDEIAALFKSDEYRQMFLENQVMS